MRSELGVVLWAGLLATSFVSVGATCSANFFLGPNLSAPSNFSCQPCTVCAAISTPCTSSSDTVCAAASSSSSLALSATWIIVICVVGGCLLLLSLAFVYLRSVRRHRTQPSDETTKGGVAAKKEKKSAAAAVNPADRSAHGDLQLRPKKEPQKLNLLQRLSSARSASTTASTDGGYVQVDSLPDYISCPLKPTRGAELSAFDREALSAVFGDPLETESSFGFPASREGSFVRHQSFGLRDSFGFPENLLEEESVLETKGLAPAARTIDLSPEPRLHDSSTEVFSPLARFPSARGSADLRSQAQSPAATTPSPVPSRTDTPAALLRLPSPGAASGQAPSTTSPPTPTPLSGSASPRPPSHTAGAAAVSLLADAATDSNRWRSLRALREHLGLGPDAMLECVQGGAVPVLLETIRAAHDSPDVQREAALCFKMLAPAHAAELLDGGVLEVLSTAAQPDSEAQEDLMLALAALVPSDIERAEPLLERGLLAAMLRVLGRAAAGALVALLVPLSRTLPGMVTAAGGPKTLLALPMFADAPTADLLLDALAALAAHMALPGAQVIGKTYKAHPNSKVRARAAALAAGKQ